MNKKQFANELHEISQDDSIKQLSTMNPYKNENPENKSFKEISKDGLESLNEDQSGNESIIGIMDLFRGINKKD